MKEALSQGLSTKATQKDVAARNNVPDWIGAAAKGLRGAQHSRDPEITAPLSHKCFSITLIAEPPEHFQVMHQAIWLTFVTFFLSSCPQGQKLVQLWGGEVNSYTHWYTRMWPTHTYMPTKSSSFNWVSFCQQGEDILSTRCTFHNHQAGDSPHI